MGFVRRLFTGLLALALTQFGVLAAVPAHAHEGGSSPHGVHMVMADGGVEHQHDHHSEHGEADLALDPSQGQAPSQGDDTEHAAHVHGCPHFAPVQHAGAGLPTPSSARVAWPFANAAAALSSSSPLLRPPRRL